jgi:hypothetical protein
MPRRQADQILKHDISVALTGMLRKNHREHPNVFSCLEFNTFNGKSM